MNRSNPHVKWTMVGLFVLVLLSVLASTGDHQGIEMVLDLLRKFDRPVVINVIGDSRTIAVAGKKAPKLFAEKCAGVYLNAGTGAPQKTATTKAMKSLLATLP